MQTLAAVGHSPKPQSEPLSISVVMKLQDSVYGSTMLGDDMIILQLYYYKPGEQ